MVDIAPTEINREAIALAEAEAKKRGEVTTAAALVLKAQDVGQKFDLEAVRNELEINAPIHGSKPKFVMPQ